MGTSTSSAGAGSGVAFDPPWLDSACDGIDGSQDNATLSSSGTDGGEDAGETDTSAVSAAPVSGVAPARRYGEARRRLSSFVETGDGRKLRGAMESFVKRGLGGSAKAASRMRTSSAAAAAIGGFLVAARDGTDAGIKAWVDSAKARGLSAKEAALEVIQRLIPTGGSLDEESAKNSMDQAISLLYEEEPTADIFALTDEQIATVMGHTVAFDVYNRVQLELGRSFEKLKYSPRVIQERLAQAREYIVAVVRDAMAKARSSTHRRSVKEISERTLRNTLDVFAES